jgi:thioredoxin 1
MDNQNKSKPDRDVTLTDENQETIRTRPTGRVKWIAMLVVILAVASLLVFKILDGRDPGPQTEPVDDVLNVTFAFDFEALKARGLPMLLDFGSESCQPCREMKPALIEINKQYQGRAVVKYVDVWEDTEAGADFPLSAVPTQFFFYADGTPYVPPAEYEAIVHDVYFAHDKNIV